MNMALSENARALPVFLGSLRRKSCGRQLPRPARRGIRAFGSDASLEYWQKSPPATGREFHLDGFRSTGDSDPALVQRVNRRPAASTVCFQRPGALPHLTASQYLTVWL
jgi:hypothetical protein